MSNAEDCGQLPLLSEESNTAPDAAQEGFLWSILSVLEKSRSAAADDGVDVQGSRLEDGFTATPGEMLPGAAAAAHRCDPLDPRSERGSPGLSRADLEKNNHNSGPSALTERCVEDSEMTTRHWSESQRGTDSTDIESIKPWYTPELAAKILQHFGLEKSDLGLLLTYPEEQLDAETLPLVLQQISIRKALGAEGLSEDRPDPRLPVERDALKHPPGAEEQREETPGTSAAAPDSKRRRTFLTEGGDETLEIDAGRSDDMLTDSSDHMSNPENHQAASPGEETPNQNNLTASHIFPEGAGSFPLGGKSSDLVSTSIKPADGGKVETPQEVTTDLCCPASEEERGRMICICSKKKKKKKKKSLQRQRKLAPSAEAAGRASSPVGLFLPPYNIHHHCHDDLQGLSESSMHLWKPSLSVNPSGAPQHHLPALGLMQDYAATPPRAFPQVCRLCHTQVADMKDWIVHQNSDHHLKNCRLLRQQYPGWDGSVPSLQSFQDSGRWIPKTHRTSHDLLPEGKRGPYGPRSPSRGVCRDCDSENGRWWRRSPSRSSLSSCRSGRCRSRSPKCECRPSSREEAKKRRSSGNRRPSDKKKRRKKSSGRLVRKFLGAPAVQNFSELPHLHTTMDTSVPVLESQLASMQPSPCSRSSSQSGSRSYDGATKSQCSKETSAYRRKRKSLGLEAKVSTPATESTGVPGTREAQIGHSPSAPNETSTKRRNVGKELRWKGSTKNKPKKNQNDSVFGRDGEEKDPEELQGFEGALEDGELDTEEEAPTEEKKGQQGREDTREVEGAVPVRELAVSKKHETSVTEGNCPTPEVSSKQSEGDLDWPEDRESTETRGGVCEDTAETSRKKSKPSEMPTGGDEDEREPGSSQAVLEDSQGCGRRSTSDLNYSDSHASETAGAAADYNNRMLESVARAETEDECQRVEFTRSESLRSVEETDEPQILPIHEGGQALTGMEEESVQETTLTRSRTTDNTRKKILIEAKQCQTPELKETPRKRGDIARTDKLPTSEFDRKEDESEVKASVHGSRTPRGLKPERNTSQLRSDGIPQVRRGNTGTNGDQAGCCPNLNEEDRCESDSSKVETCEAEDTRETEDRSEEPKRPGSPAAGGSGHVRLDLSVVCTSAAVLTDPAGPHSKPLCTSQSSLPTFNPELSFGLEFVVPELGYFCTLCAVFYVNESAARDPHCCSLAHYNNLEKLYRKPKQELELYEPISD